MIDINKNYWLYIAPHVYCCFKNDEALLYNTHNGAHITIDSHEIIALLRTLHNRENLGAVLCEGKLLMTEPYRDFAASFCENEMGDVVDVEIMPEKPIQLMPVLNLQRDMDRKHKYEEILFGENALHYLTEINLYLHTACRQNCRLCDDYFRQTLCCHTSETSKIMDISTIEHILMQIRYGVVGRINLLGGNIFEYSFFEKLTICLMDFKDRVRVWNHYANFCNYENALPDFHYEIPVTFPIKPEEWEHSLKILKEAQVRYQFFITGVEEYEQALALVENYGIGNYAIRPVYTRSNLAFFEEYVYADRNSIFKSKIPFRQIFANQKLNTHFFGSLTVMPDGDIFANVNCSSLGNIAGDTLLNIICKEMLDNTAWRRIRDAKPCSDCLYQYLCPSPSNYETVIERINLCHIKK